MKFLKNLFGAKQAQNSTLERRLTIKEFWNWFELNQARFYKAIKQQEDIQGVFVQPVFNQLNKIKEGAFFTTGMMNDHTAEIIFTAEGNLLNFPFIKDIVDSSPQLDNWHFTAFKPQMDFEDSEIRIGPIPFSVKNIKFYSEIDTEFPDNININFVYTDHNSDKELVERGILIFLDNYLGEVKTATQIDRISFDHDVDINDPKLNPVSKLAEYINWREKEFEEKYEATIHNSDDSNYASLEWENKNKPLIGVVNTDLMRWDKKASHPWILVITISYGGKRNNGLPSQEAIEKYYDFEDKLRQLLPDHEGFLHVAQITGLGKREIFFANKEFMKPVQVLEDMKSQVNFDYDVEIFKDKYWQSLKNFEH